MTISITDFHPDILWHIHSYFDEKTAEKVAQVCRQFRDMQGNYPIEMRKLIQEKGLPCLTSWTQENSKLVLTDENKRMSLVRSCRFEKRFCPSPSRWHLISFDFTKPYEFKPKHPDEEG